MNKFESITKPLKWLTALLLVSVVAGCNGADPILGGSGNSTTDLTRPRVTSTVPANLEATFAPANAKITATFNEAMDPATITAAGTFTLKETVSGTNVAGGAVVYTVGSRTASFKPTASLTVGTNYTATITTAAKDLAGNALAGVAATPSVASNHVWTFTSTVPDVTAPTVTLTSPANLATAVVLNATVNATFSEAMDPATISATTFTLATSAVPAVSVSAVVTYDPALKIATLTPSSNLVANTGYTATITTTVTDLAGNALAAGAKPNPWTFTTGTALAPGTVALGTAGTFGIMATSAITSTGNSIINGDVSLNPGTSMTGFPPAIVNGAIHINDSVSVLARNDLLAAYNYAKGLPPGTTIPAGADLGAFIPTGGVAGVLPPGTYTSGSTMLVSTPLTLDAGGNANAVWVFQIGSSLTTNVGGGNVTLANGAQAKNVFWVPTSDATIGVGTTFNGTIVSGRDVTAQTGSVIDGRILAGAILAGTIALQSATVNVPLP